MNQEEVINNSFTQECRAEGFPTPSIQWYLNNTMITNTSNRYIVDTTSVNSITSILRVRMAEFTDSGLYQCEANSSVFIDNVKSDMMNISVVGECRSTCNYSIHTSNCIHEFQIVSPNFRLLQYSQASSCNWIDYQTCFCRSDYINCAC